MKSYKKESRWLRRKCVRGGWREPLNAMTSGRNPFPATRTTETKRNWLTSCHMFMPRKWVERRWRRETERQKDRQTERKKERKKEGDTKMNGRCRSSRSERRNQIEHLNASDETVDVLEMLIILWGFLKGVAGLFGDSSSSHDFSSQSSEILWILASASRERKRWRTPTAKRFISLIWNRIQACRWWSNSGKPARGKRRIR